MRQREASGDGGLFLHRFLRKRAGYWWQREPELSYVTVNGRLRSTPTCCCGAVSPPTLRVTLKRNVFA